MIRGINSFVGAPSGARIGPAWVQQLVDLGVQAVRFVVTADDANQLQLAPYQAGADLLHAAGIRTLAVLTMALDRPWVSPTVDRHFYPNEPLGYRGNRRQNRYILDFARRAQQVAEALAPHGVTSYQIWNEPNLRGLLPIGANVPPLAPQPAALAPAVFGALCYETAGYLRIGGATDIRLGSLSCVGNGVTGPDAHNPYLAAYLFEALAFLRGTGVPSLPFSHLCLNSELWWTSAQATAIQQALHQAVLAAGYTPLPLCIAEWGDTNAAYDATQVPATIAALETIGAELYFFQHPYQAGLGGYGITGWTVAGTQFVPEGPQSAWWPPVAAWLQGG